MENNAEKLMEWKSCGAKIVVDFSAEWCGPCKMFAPVFKSTSLKMPAFKFIKIDVDECRDLAREYNVQSVPYLVVFEGEKIIKERAGGFPNEDTFMSWLKS